MTDDTLRKAVELILQILWRNSKLIPMADWADVDSMLARIERERDNPAEAR